MHLSAEETALAGDLAISPHHLLFVKEMAAAPLSSLTLTDAEGAVYPGVKVRVDHHDDARRLVRALNGRLAKTPWRAFTLATDYTSEDRAELLGLREEDAQRRLDNVVGLLMCERDDTILRLRQTRAPEKKLDTDGLRKQLAVWREGSSFTIIGAGRRWLELDFHTLPADLGPFSRDVYEICPEAIYIDPYQTFVSPDEVATPLDAPDITDMLSEGEEHDALETFRDHLETTKRLFLWWS